MGYFPNGSAGEDYQAQWCRHCVHDINEDCAVWMAHLRANYEDCGNPASVLHVLIPRKGIDNQMCRLFVPVARLGGEDDAP